MNFQTDIFKEVAPPSSSKYSLAGTRFPTSQDVYFMSKWHGSFDDDMIIGVEKNGEATI
ncbi:MAG: hypothetical protein KH296_08840 [Ruminococcus sp.]|jgi:hypothetical protein|nr:hypothetical protein [Ruminococcus sp.]